MNGLNAVNQLGFTIELLAACLIFMLPLRKRPHFALRLAVSVGINIAVSVFFPAVDRSFLLIAARFGVKYLAALGMAMFCLNVSWTDAFYCSICGYEAQHLASSICFLLGALLHDRAVSVT